MTSVIVLNVVWLVVAGFAKAVKDTVAHHYYSSVFYPKGRELFWNPRVSWENKWQRNGNQVVIRERFWGSSRWFSWTTDAWHFFDTVHSTAYHMLLVTNLMACCFMDVRGVAFIMAYAEWWWMLAYLACAKLIVGGVFELFYSRLLIKK